MNKTTWLLVALGTIGAVLFGTRAAMASPTPPEPSGPPPPAPPGGRETGTAFFERVRGLSQAQQDAAALQAAADGSFPARALGWITVPLRAGSLSGEVVVMADFFGVGTDEDWIRWPLMPGSAQRLADMFDAVLPTQKIAQAVLAAATRIDMPTYAPPHTIEMYKRANDLAIRRVGTRTGLIDGEKKYVLAADDAHPGKVIIWGGWHASVSAVWQPYSWIHDDRYEDYSHGIRLVKREMRVDGATRDILDVMRDPTLASLVSGSRTERATRYRT